MIGTKINTQINGDTDQEGLINNPKELANIKIKGVTK